MNELLKKLERGLVVSCQSDQDDPFFSPDLTTKFAIAAQLGGAAGIRTEGTAQIKSIRAEVDLPLIGIIDGQYDTGWICVTPDFFDIDEILSAGADMVALDVTPRKRPNGMDGIEFFDEVRRRYPVPLIADISTFEEGIRAAEMGADAVATTLSGYTEYTQKKLNNVPDYTLIEELSRAVKVPVMAQGRVWTAEQAKRVIECGAFCVVAGSAITRPKMITKKFVDAISMR